MNKYVEAIPSYRFTEGAFERCKAYRIIPKNSKTSIDVTFVRFDELRKFAMFNSSGDELTIKADDVGREEVTILTMVPGINIALEDVQDIPVWKRAVEGIDPWIDEINGYPHRFRVPDNNKIGDVVPDPNEVTCTTVTGGTIGGIPFGKVTVESNNTSGIMINPNPGNLYDTPTMEEREKFFTDVPNKDNNE